MRLRPRCAAVLLLLLVPSAAQASDHVASMYGAYSELHGSRFRGLQFGLEVSWPTTDKIHDYLGILVDAAVHGGTNDVGERLTKAALLVGLRGLYKIPPVPRVVLFAHGLVGGHRSHLGPSVEDGLAWGAGGGVDVIIGDATQSGWAVRGQVDWLNVARETSPRGSIGVVFRFKE